MQPQSNLWLPLTEYALRSGMSISTLRRKIKSNTISYKMEEGRYLIRGDELAESPRATGFSSSDEPQQLSRAVVQSVATTSTSNTAELEKIRDEIRRIQEDNVLRWKALEARVAGLAKKLEFFSEQMAETKMLVKIFEEKLDGRA
jgi:hypothetical protein